MKLNKLTMFALGAALSMGFTACNDDDITVVGYGEPLQVVSAPLADQTAVTPWIKDIKVNFNTDVALNTISKILVNNTVPDEVTADGSELNIHVEAGLFPTTEYTVTLLPYSVTAADADLHSFLTEAYTFTFTTDKDFYFLKQNVAKTLVNPNATPEAKKVYQFLYDNYGENTLTGAMGGVGWENGYTDFIASKAGKYPAIVGYDYIHLYASTMGANWINYGDITPVKTAWEAGSIPAFSWHWNVPEYDSNDEGPFPTFTNTIWEGNFDGQNWGNWMDLSTAGWVDALNEGDYLIFKSKDGGALGLCLEDWSGKVGGTDFFQVEGGNVTYQLSAADIADLKANATIHIGGTAAFTAIIHADQPALEPAIQYIYNGKFSPLAALTPGTRENNIINADIAAVAGYLKLLQDAGIPVLWRPLHEAAGDYTWGSWFWWGNDGVEATKQLYLYLYDQLTNVYGLNNLIWVWTMQTYDNGELCYDFSKMQAAYPGDQYVDIVGIDSYEKETGVDITTQYRVVANVIGQSKILALSEIGNLIDFQAGKNNQAVWSFFMNWYTMNEYGEWSIDNKGDVNASNTRKVWQQAVNLPFLLSRGDFSVK